MKQLKIRLAQPEESAQIVNWLNANPSNDFDPNILQYPTLQVICAYNGKPVSYLPVHRALVLESVAVSPDASELDKAQALRDLVKAAQLMASAHQIKELYFMVSDPMISNIAEQHGFEVTTVCRMKL